MNATQIDVPPCCPARPSATAAFCIERWNVRLHMERWGATLERRERVLRSLRSAGDPRAADAAGWLMLAGVLADLPVQLVRRLGSTPDPAALADDIATAADHGYGALRASGDGPPGRYSPLADLDVIDAGSRSAWTIADTAGRAGAELVVVVDGAPTVPSALRRLLRMRMEAALGDQGTRR